jgi:hypothetical protein
MPLKIEESFHDFIVEYEISGNSFEVQRAIVDIYNQYPARDCATFVHEHTVSGDGQAYAFMTREIEDSLAPAKGLTNTCLLGVGFWAVIIVIAVLISVLK